MASDDMTSDDYVGTLLAEDAKDFSLKYSALGLEAYKSNRPSSKLKPNTRFLRHIIKETKHHNEALLAKEAAESQARLQDLDETEEAARRKARPDAKVIRQRQLGQIAAILGSRKRKHGDEKGPKAESRPETSAAPRDSSRSPGHRDDDTGRRHTSRRPRVRSRDRQRDAEVDSEKERSYSEKKRRRHRSPSADGERTHRRRGTEDESVKERSHRHKRRRHHSVSDDEPRRRRERHRSRSRSPGKRHLRDGSQSRGVSGLSRLSPPSEDDGPDSDPLEELLGPPPPAAATRTAVVRGRGAVAESSGVHTRFSNGYDPAVDVTPDIEDGGDWDDTLEAFRDRRKWEQEQASRLKEAGFSDEQVKKWARGGEKDIDDVQWTNKGEMREWDRGK